MNVDVNGKVDGPVSSDCAGQEAPYEPIPKVVRQEHLAVCKIVDGAASSSRRREYYIVENANSCSS